MSLNQCFPQERIILMARHLNEIAIFNCKRLSLILAKNCSRLNLTQVNRRQFNQCREEDEEKSKKKRENSKYFRLTKSNLHFHKKS